MDTVIKREPLPGPLRPMMAAGTGLPPSDAGWAYEMKWDGQRALAYLDGTGVKLLSRTERDITTGYPEFAALAEALDGRQALIDGEIVALEDGVPSFAALQERMHATPGEAAALVSRVPATYFAFDVLHVDGQSLLRASYRQRREILDALQITGPSWHTPPSFTDVPGAPVLAASAKQGLEGVMAKRLDARYLPGVRSPDWRKVKHFRHQEAVVGGWRPGKGLREGSIGSLLVGVHTAEGLAYAGRVGTGFDDRTLQLLAARLSPLASDVCPFIGVPREVMRDARWVRPELVVDVEFDRWTRDDRLRHPTYRGLRTDKEPQEVTRAE